MDVRTATHTWAFPSLAPWSSLLLLIIAGCGGPSGHTRVTGHLEPKHFQFITINPHRGNKPGGWRAACVHAHLKRTSGDAYVCRFGVEMPLVTEENGPISTSLAQRLAADCANQVAYGVFHSTTMATPLGLACESFKNAYGALLNNVIRGSRVPTVCHARTTPVEFGP